MKKSKHILAIFFTFTILLLQLASVFHVSQHSNEDHKDEILKIQNNDELSFSSSEQCLLCDFFTNTEIAILPNFTSITIINMSFSTPEITHILKKKIFYILHKKSRAPPRIV